jgi:hypothetical protein
MGCRQALVGGRYALVELSTRQLAPDFYVQLLWRQLMSPKVLRVVKAAAGPAADRLAPHLRAYGSCARTSTALPGLNLLGGVSLLLINTHPNTTFFADVDNLPVLEDPAEATNTQRLEFVLTSAAQPLRDRGERGGGGAGGGGERTGQEADGGGGGGGGGGTEAAAAAAADEGGGVDSETLLKATKVRLNGALLEPDASGGLPRLRSVRPRGATIVVPPLSVSYHVFPEAGVKGCMTEKQEKTTSKLKKAKGKMKPKASSSELKPVGGAAGGGCDGDAEFCRNQRRK